MNQQCSSTLRSRGMTRRTHPVIQKRSRFCLSHDDAKRDACRRFYSRFVFLKVRPDFARHGGNMKVRNLRSVVNLLLSLALLTTCIVSSSHAQPQGSVVPTLVNFKGTLIDVNGKPLNGTVVGV